MMRAIADSDDDEDDLAFVVHDANVETVLPKVSETTSAVAIEIHHEKSTGSTEILRRQIESAERKLGTNSTNSPPEAMDGDTYLSSASPSIRANKRRHTSALDSEAAHSSDRSAKRAKNTKTYGSRHRTQSLLDSNFDRLNNDDTGPRTSQLATFTEHSGVASSLALLPGSLEDGFLNHEPNVMFHDSGSTFADNSSTEKRLLEQVLGTKQHLTVPSGDNMESGEHLNSSLAWSTSPYNDSTMSSRTEEGARKLTAEEDPLAPAQDDLPKKLDSTPPLTDSRPQITRSPAVEIRRDEVDIPVPAPSVTTSTQKDQKRHKSKADEEKDLEALVSDDRPIGLPKEEYKPRPSKRRATQLVVGPIDFSVRPEKAAKAKRTKTSHAAGDSMETDSNSTQSFRDDGRSVPTAEPVADPQDARESTFAKGNPADSVSERPPKPLQPRDDTQESPNQDSMQDDGPSQAVSEQKCEDEIVVKSTKSAQKIKSASRTKRSQTTIFEDHVEFETSQQALNLNQQQANRKSALQSVSNEATSMQRKRKLVVSDNEDDEEELAKQAKEVLEEEPAPKKRPRGRPPKSTIKSQPVPVDKALEASKDKDEDHARESEDPPEKEGHAKSFEANTALMDPDGSDAPEAKARASRLSEKAPEKTSAERSETPLTIAASAASDASPSSTKLLTPSPKKQENPSKDVKPSPTSHSPIKRTSKVPFRLGLSNRQRIPSLLRTMRPRGK